MCRCLRSPSHFEPLSLPPIYRRDFPGEERSYKYRGLIYLLGSASAEFFADIALCPMEMVKVKVVCFWGGGGSCRGRAALKLLAFGYAVDHDLSVYLSTAVDDLEQFLPLLPWQERLL